MYAVSVFAAVLLAGQAAAVAVTGPSVLTALLKRQAGFDPSDIPAQCQSDCSAAVNAINTCSDDLSCLCSSTVNNGLYNCLECALALEPDATILQQGQASLTEYEQSCQEGGINLPALTLTLPAAAATATATGSSNTGTAAVTFNSGGSTAAATAPANSAAATNAATSATGAQPASKSSDPLARNGAGVVGVSVASVMGAVGVAVAALAL